MTANRRARADEQTAYDAWRASAYAVGAHLLACVTCEPRPGGRAVRNACAEYAQADAVECAAYDAYEQARREGHDGR